MREIPKITYPPNLPVTQYRAEIRTAIEKNQVVIIAGETGSGKTTQIPKICLELGRGTDKIIGHTQPRRIAARTVAERISTELGVTLGEAIGYQIRFAEKTSPATAVKLMTDGILLAEIQSDPQLLRYDTIIIDEAHERSLNIDFLLGYLSQLLPKRPDLKLIITSATIDAQRFAEHFGEYMHGGYKGNVAPIISVSGRTYPVEIRYRPLNEPLTEYEETENFTPRDQITGIIDATNELMQEGNGDILVFLSGEGEIRETEKALRDELGNRYIAPNQNSKTPNAIEVLPLFARLSNQEQVRIFNPRQHRRIILATNIAETSITVPGIKYVIDTGTARISRYSPKTKVQRLPIEPISQASANQRAGRCGRVADGVAIRLYSETDFLTRDEFTEPEILRTSLSSVILQMTALGLGKIKNFPFIATPDIKSVRSGIQLLEEIGAIKHGGKQLKLTKIGRTLAKLPIDPRLGRMLLEAKNNGCGAEVLILVAAMSVQDVRERPLEFQTQADQLHARFTDPQSDFLAYLNLWRYLLTQQRELSGNAFRRMCRDEYINWLRFKQWQDLVNQLQQLSHPLGIALNKISIPNEKQLQIAREKTPDTSQNRDVINAIKHVGHKQNKQKNTDIHRSLLVGLLSNLGNWDERKRNYIGARGHHFIIWPGSGLYRRNPSWVMSAELVETSQVFARSVAKIEPEWIEEAAEHLVKRQYGEPFWSARKNVAMVNERVTLYGMTLIADRKVLLSKINLPNAKPIARELFIKNALVERQWRNHHEFYKHNGQMLEQAQKTQDKMRQYGLIADDSEQFLFFAKRIPENIISTNHFDFWWKKERIKNPHLLDFTQDFLLGADSFKHDDFPNWWEQGEFSLPIHYTFSPDKYADGLTIDVPVTVLPKLQEVGFDWLIPGMQEELIVSTIRALPKNVRRNLVPAPDVAREILLHFPAWEKTCDPKNNTGSFQDTFKQIVQELRGFTITKEHWQQVILPNYLQITFRIKSERGAVLEEGTNLKELQQKLAPKSKKSVAHIVKESVAEAIKENPQTQAETQLIAKINKEITLPIARITSRWTPTETLILASSPYVNTAALVTDIHLTATRNITQRWGKNNRVKLNKLDAADLEILIRYARNVVEDEIYRIVKIAVQIFGKWAEVHQVLTQTTASRLINTVEDIKTHLNELVYDGCLSKIPDENLADIPRYLNTELYRMEKAKENLDADMQHSAEIMQIEILLEKAWQEFFTTEFNKERYAALQRARWLIEELRVSLFAQQLGTKQKVSVVRIKKLLSGTPK